MDIYRQPGRKPKGCLHKNWTRRQSSLWAGVERREGIHASCSASQQHPSVWAPLKASTTSGSCTNHPFWGNLHNNRVFLEKQFKDKWFPPLKSLVCSKTLHDFWSTCTWEGGKRERGSGYMKVVRIFFFFLEERSRSTLYQSEKKTWAAAKNAILPRKPHSQENWYFCKGLYLFFKEHNLPDASPTSP